MPRVIGRRVYRYQSVDSTQNLAADLGRRDEAEGAVVVAEEQTGGRGRRGRTWFSPSGGGLWFSVLLRPRLDPSLVPLVTLSAGVALARAVRDVTGLDAVIKWPNDLLLGTRKFGGVLAEAVGASIEERFLVLGVGLNVNVAGVCFPPELRDAVTSLSIVSGKALAPAPLFERALGELDHQYRRLLDEGFAGIRQDWLHLAGNMGGEVRVNVAGGNIVGRAVDLADDGCLVLELPGGDRTSLLAGEAIWPI